VSFIEGASLYEFHPDEQNDVSSDLRHIISDGDEQIANKFRKYRKINNITKILISTAITSVIGYITGSVLGYLPLISVLWILIATLIFIASISLAFYLLFFTSKVRKRSLIRWRQSIITKLSTKTLEWQTKSKPFAFTIYYPIHDISYGRKNKIVNIRGIIRITLGMPKFISTKEPIYFQAVPRERLVRKRQSRQHHSLITLPIDRNHIDEGSSQSLEIMKQNKRRNINKNKISIKRNNHYRRRRDQKLGQDQRDKISLIANDDKLSIQIEDIDKDKNVSLLQHPKLVNDHSNGSNKTSISIAVEVDDNGNVHNHKQQNDDESVGGITMSRRGTIEYDERKTLPIMINGDNGQRILLQGIKTMINGQEVILINNNKNKRHSLGNNKIKRNIPISPVEQDLDYNNDCIIPMSIPQVSISPMNQRFLEMD